MRPKIDRQKFNEETDENLVQLIAESGEWNNDEINSAFESLISRASGLSEYEYITMNQMLYLSLSVVRDSYIHRSEIVENGRISGCEMDWKEVAIAAISTGIVTGVTFAIEGVKAGAAAGLAAGNPIVGGVVGGLAGF